MAYTGKPVSLDDLLFRPAHSIVQQSLASKMGAETTNGDGFGVGWYTGSHPIPGRYRSVEPAWNDGNLHDIAGAIEATTMFGHVRAATGSPVQLTNCHPFRHGNSLFMHNGAIGDFGMIRRQLLIDVEPALFPGIHGSTDSEVMMMLAVGFGLRDDPKTALERMVSHIEQVARDAGIEPHVQMTVAATDGSAIVGARYATSGTARSLFHSAEISTVRSLYPDLPVLQDGDDNMRFIVSEPIADLPGAWIEVPEASWFRFGRDGSAETQPFTPSRAAAAV